MQLSEQVIGIGGGGMNENEKDMFFEILNTLIKIEEKRNESLKKTLNTFFYIVVAVVALLSVFQLIFLNTLFVK